MAKKVKTAGRTLALTIIIGVFVSAMVISLSNLTVDYIYERPRYENFCNNTWEQYFSPAAKSPTFSGCGCNYSTALQAQEAECTSNRGMPVYDYYENGCVKSVKACDMCQKNFEDSMKKYNHNVFFVFAAIGFVMIAIGLFLPSLLLLFLYNIF